MGVDPQPRPAASHRLGRASPVGAAWRAFDLQLTTYAGAAAAIGLAMAYTNSVETGARRSRPARPSPAA